MEEERKVYSVVGTVTIGTDEYKDLLSEKYQALADNKDLERRNSDYFWKVRDLEEQNKNLKLKLDEVNKYLKENDEQDSFELWILRTSRGE